MNPPTGPPAPSTPPASAPSQEPGRFDFDGRQVAFRPGQSVAAALWAAGVRAGRTTRGAGAGRGLFCGIGICFDCLMVIDEQPNERACLAQAADGMQVRTQRGTR